MCLVGAVGRGQIFQLIHDAPGFGFNPAVMQSRNVGFGCPFSDRSAVSFHTAFGHSQVSFTITEKTTTAIVGPSGAGKTTMCNLIARFWDVNAGKITIGGTDVRDFKLDSLMKNISMVFQSVYLFADTIENNIKFGCPDATHEQVVEAAKKACCHNFISALPDGYDTVISEGGGTLSGGEKQRISIARAMLKDAPIPLSTMGYWTRRLAKEDPASEPEQDLVFARLPSEQEAARKLLSEETASVRIFISDSIRIEISDSCRPELMESILGFLWRHA